MLTIKPVRRKMVFKISGPENNTISARINKLLESYELSDCSFLISGKIFKAHKLILGITSPVFEAMFYGPLSSNDAIIITDIEPNIFQTLLNYIYTDSIKIKSVEEAYDLLYVSRKYMLEYLTEACAAYLIRHINIDNVISILNYPDYMQDKEVVSCALRLFGKHAEYLFQEHTQSINPVCMQIIVQSNEMNITEKDLIKHVFEWTSYYCEQNDIKNTLVNRREVLDKNGIFKHLRFYSLSPNDMKEVINYNDNLLNTYEVEDIEKFDISAMTVNEKILGSLDNKFIPRKTISFQWEICQRTPIRSEPPIIINLNNTTVQTRININETVAISSLNVPSRMTSVIEYVNPVAKLYNEQFTITIFSEAENSIVRKMQFKKNVEYDSLIDITFDKPVILKKNHNYKITFTWPYANYCPHYYAVQTRDKCYMNGIIKFLFEDIFRLACDGGSFLRGLKYSL
ncbi:unnamed protein product, partial [Brenthis ino]